MSGNDNSKQMIKEDSLHLTALQDDVNQVLLNAWWSDIFSCEFTSSWLKVEEQVVSLWVCQFLKSLKF